jgi:excisionase family DNA binding protein
MTPRLRSLRDTAIELGVSKDTVRRWISRGLVRAVRLGKRLLVAQTELDRLVASGTQQPAVQPPRAATRKSRSPQGRSNTKTAAPTR